jgi:transposase
MANLPRGEITGSHIGDAPVLPDLLSQIPASEEIGSVTADGAYDTRKCHDAIANRGAHAVIPPRKNAKPWTTVTAGAVARNEALRVSKYLGRAIWRNWSGYHRRSRVETKPLGIMLRITLLASGCIALNCWGSASWRGTSTDRSQKSRSASPS